LKSNTTLQLEPGACLLGSSDVRQYPSIGRASEDRSTALVWALGARNIGITGAGVIDGNGRAFVSKGHLHSGLPFYDPSRTRQGAEVFSRYEQNREGPVEMLARPGVLVLFVECENVDLRGFNVVDASNWSVHLACCRHAVINGLNVLNSLLIPNADAIDVSNSQDVRISDVYLEAGDDGIAIGACAIGYCSQMAENITVSNAVIVSRSAAIRIGWSADDIRDLVFNNIIIRDSNRGIVRYDEAGLNAENVDGLTLRNSSLHWTSTVPSFFCAGIAVAGFRDATIDGFSGAGPSDATPAIWLRKGTGATVTAARTTRGPLLLYQDVTDTVDTNAGSK
jgi:polygalacturonase